MEEEGAFSVEEMEGVMEGGGLSFVEERDGGSGGKEAGGALEDFEGRRKGIWESEGNEDGGASSVGGK